MNTTVKKPKIHIRRGDIVIAIRGADAASKKTGKVLQVLVDKGRAVVEGFNYCTKHMRKSQDNPQGGRIQKEAAVAISNLKLHVRGEESELNKSKAEAPKS